MPAVALEVPPVFVFTGKTLGVAEVHVRVGEFVRSRTYGTLENVPIAKNCALSCRLPTVIALGMMVSDSRGSAGGVLETAMVALAVTTLLSGFVSSAVTVVMPAALPVARPAPLTTAIEGLLELHAIAGELVTSLRSPVLPLVAMATNCPVCPEAESAWLPGVIDSAVYFCVVPPLTVKAAVPVTTVPELL